MRVLSLVLFVAIAHVAPAAVLAQAKQERDAAAPAGQLSAVGQGERMGRKPLAPGAYVTTRHRPAAEAWLRKHRGRLGPADWEIGAPLPGGAPTRAAPADLRALLPAAPPGTRYLLWGDAVLLVAQSRMVVDAVTAGVKPPSSSPR
jgi:hypothetical protein